MTTPNSGSLPLTREVENADELVNATNEASLTTPNSGSTDSDLDRGANPCSLGWNNLKPPLLG